MTTTDWVLLGVGLGQILVLGGTLIFIGVQVTYAKKAHETMVRDQKTMIQMERDRKAYEYIVRWSSQPIEELRHKAAAAIGNKKVEEEHHAVLGYLNFFFELALAVDSKIADDELSKSFFRKPLHFYWSQVEPYLLDTHNQNYDRVKRLDSRWQATDPSR